MCYGSFLNVVAYRLIKGHSLIGPRSFCPNCKTQIAWYDLIPIISFILLNGKCRHCKQSISYLYPIIELITAISFTSLIYLIEPNYWLSYSIFFTALIIIIRTDAETMLISSFTTLIPIISAFIFSYLNLLPITILQSFAGAFFGYFILWSIAKIFYIIKGIKGMGEGDFEILALIGSFSGIVGAWYSLFIGSLLGSCYSILLLTKGSILKNAKIPFGPWLAIGAISYILFFKLYF